MIQNVTKSCRELAKYVRIKETLLNAAGVARGPRAGGTRMGPGGGTISSKIFAALETKSVRVIPTSTFITSFMMLQKNNLLLFGYEVHT